MGRSLQANIVVLLLCIAGVFGDSLQVEEGISGSEPMVQDSATLETQVVDSLVQTFKLDMTYYLNDFKSDVTYSLLKTFPRSTLAQDFHYTVEYDRNTLQRQQHITFDGNALWGNGTRFGVEWLPLLYESDYVDQDSGYGVVSMSLGPLVTGAVWGVPFSVSGGYTFDVWNENLAKDWLKTSMEYTSFDDGAYFTFKAGSDIRPLIKNSNLYSLGQINGRYMRGLANSKVTRGDVLVAYRAASFMKSDSLVLTFVDTLIHGRVETPYEHKSSYLENSVRVDNLSSVGVDITNIGDAFIEPTVSVYLSQKQYRYPFSDNNSSRQDRELATAVSYEKALSKKVTITGEFGVTVGAEDHLYEKSDKEILNSDKISDKTGNLDDAEVFQPLLAQGIHIVGDRFLSFDYDFSIERDRKRYPFYYTSYSDTVRSSSDFDKQHMSHLAKLGFTLTPKLSLFLSADYHRELSYYLSPRASKNSFSRDRYKVELAAQYDVDSLSFVASALGGYVEPKEFLYKQSTHSRNFYGRVDGTQVFNQRFKILYSGEGRLYDRGDWFGSGGYGISRKSREITTELTSAFMVLPPAPGRKHITALQLSAGFEGAFERTKDWNFTTVQFNKGTNLYKTTPVGGCTLVVNKGFTIKLDVKRYFDRVVDIELYDIDKNSTLPEDQRYTGDLQKYWDISLSLTYGG